MSAEIPKRHIESEMNGIDFAVLQAQSVDLLRRKESLELEEGRIMQEFKKMFAPAMLELRPGVYAIIKPSRRQEITSAKFLRGDVEKEPFFMNAAEEMVSLVEHEDYKIFRDNGPLTPEYLSDPFIVEVLEELN